MRTLTGNKAPVDTFDRCFQFDVEHISLAKQADVVMVAPATANVAAKLAHGIADDMLTTTVLACKCPKLLSPAMNTQMYENPVTQDNLRILREYGWQVVEPASGHLACGDSGKGKLPEPEVLLDWILQTIAREKDMARPKGAGHCRPHPGGPGPGAVSHQPLLRENGLRHCQGCRPPGRPGNAGHRPHRFGASPVCGDRGDCFSGGYVPGSDHPGPGAGHHHQGGGGWRTTPLSRWPRTR